MEMDLRHSSCSNIFKLREYLPIVPIGANKITKYFRSWRSLARTFNHHPILGATDTTSLKILTIDNTTPPSSSFPSSNMASTQSVQCFGKKKTGTNSNLSDVCTEM